MKPTSCYLAWDRVFNLNSHSPWTWVYLSPPDKATLVALSLHYFYQSFACSFSIFSLLEIAFHSQQISRLLPSQDKIGCCVFSQTQLLFGQECVCDFYCRFYVSCSANLPLSILWHSWFASFSARYVCIDTKGRLLFHETNFQMQNCHHRKPSNCPQNNF